MVKVLNHDDETRTRRSPYKFAMLNNPKILKLVFLVHFLYLDIGQGLGDETFGGRRSIMVIHCVNV